MNQPAWTPNESALRKYATLCAEAEELCNRVAKFIDDHGEVAPDEVRWTNIGIMTEVVDKLKNLKRFIDGKDPDP